MDTEKEEEILSFKIHMLLVYQRHVVDLQKRVRQGRDKV